MHLYDTDLILRTESLWCTADSSPLTWVITVCDLYRIHQNIPFPNRTTMNYLMNFLGWPLTHEPQWFIYCKRQNLETNELNLLILNITGPKTNALVWKGLVFLKNVSEIIFVKIISEASRKLITENSIWFPTPNCFPEITSFSRFLHDKKLGFQKKILDSFFENNILGWGTVVDDVHTRPIHRHARLS